MAEDQSHNPFATGAYTDGDAYGGGGDAYGDVEAGGGGAPAPPPRPDAGGGAAPPDYATDYATAAATDAATQQISSAYDETAADVQASQDDTAGAHAAPGAPRWIDRFVDWLPVRYVATFGGVLLIAFPILDFLTLGDDMTFAVGMLLNFLMLSGILIVFIEMPSCKLNRGVQLKVFFWVKLLSRMWGRCWFYFLLSIICFSTFEATGEATFTGFAGVILFITMLAMVVASYSAAQKYRRIYEFVSAGKEGEERDALFDQKFDELSGGVVEDIASEQILTLATQAGRDLGNAQLHAIQSFLDESCNGRVLKKDFIDMFATYNIGQKFL